MPTYPVKHKETGETKELSMTMKQYDQWRKDNPDWDKDWQAGVGGSCDSQGINWKNKMSKTHPEWNSFMKEASRKIPGNTIEW
jgi:hypothetical protein